VPTVLLIDVPESRALALEERLAVDGCLVRRATGWPTDRPEAGEVDVVLAHTADPAALALAVRRLSRAPLVLVSGAAAPARVAALTCGADVCLADTEPEPVVEAHVTALLRRWQPRVRHQVETVQVGELALDPPARRAQVDGVDLELRPREFDLLVALARSSGRAFRRHELLDLVWGPRFVGGVNTVDVHISWLRQKLPAAARVRITTLRGVGYRLDELSRPAFPVTDQGAGTADVRPEPEGDAAQPGDAIAQPEDVRPQPEGPAPESGGAAPQPGGAAPQPEGAGVLPDGTAPPPNGTAPETGNAAPRPEGGSVRPEDALPRSGSGSARPDSAFPLRDRAVPRR
jgi:DNA-binding response OmpR family regulator